MQVVPEKRNSLYGEGSGAISSRPAFSGICIYHHLAHPPKVWIKHPAVQTGKRMGGFGITFKQSDYVKLASGCLSGLACTHRSPSEAGTSETEIPSYRWNTCTGAERTGTEKYVRFLYVGLLQHQRCCKSHPLLRVPAGTKREISGSVSEGIWRLYPYRRLLRIQCSFRSKKMSLLYASAPSFRGCAPKRHP